VDAPLAAVFAHSGGMLETAQWTGARDDTPLQTRRLSLVIVQEAPGFWLARGLEHDIIAEGRTIGAALRAAVKLIEAHTAFDIRHAHKPLEAFRAAPQSCWNAHTAGTPVSLVQLGVAAPSGWEICAAIAHARPTRSSY
jgi:hypothetical protein